ncbi:MAG: helix-turn-helix transcriptional regulator [Nitrososphaerales archaeon]|nr:helix-turn-helix transcriptional regulator [Nitrososphaerales archaeon]
MNEAETRNRLSPLVSPEVLADETKLRIMKFLSFKEKCEYEIMFMLNILDAPQHLKDLEKEGIVMKRPEGPRTFYSLVNPEIGKILTDL